jgi:hypothetical protein
VTVKLAFFGKQQEKLFHELSVYTRLESKGVQGIPLALGIFHNAKDNGPYCLVLSNTGHSIRERKAFITVSQLYVILFPFDEYFLTVLYLVQFAVSCNVGVHPRCWNRPWKSWTR